MKVTFLGVVTSARRIAELGVLSANPSLCFFFIRQICTYTMLHMDPTFQSKLSSSFHREQEIYLPSFCPDTKHPEEVICYPLEIRRALKTYLLRNQQFQKFESFFINISPSNLGHKLFATTMGTTIQTCIVEAYKASKTKVPKDITVHSVRNAATNADFSIHVSVEEFCRAAV